MKRPRFWAHDGATAEEDRKYFKREGKAWSLLGHPNILPFCGVIEITSDMYLVSPWIAYGDAWGFLTARLKYLELPPNERNEHPGHLVYNRYREFDIVLGLARGLAYLHSKEIVHGDVKSQNVLLETNLNPLLCDFGMTKLLDGDYSASSSALLNGSGSLRWLAPELMTGSGQLKRKESDLYAFSMTITEILTGQTPFPGLNYFYLANQVISGTRPQSQPREREGQDFDMLWKVAETCWDSDPTKRPSANAVVATLTGKEAEAAIPQSPEVTGPPLQRSIPWISSCVRAPFTSLSILNGLFWDFLNHLTSYFRYPR